MSLLALEVGCCHRTLSPGSTDLAQARRVTGACGQPRAQIQRFGYAPQPGDSAAARVDGACHPVNIAPLHVVRPDVLTRDGGRTVRGS
jgi:hypothetical protein